MAVRSALRGTEIAFLLFVCLIFPFSADPLMPFASIRAEFATTSRNSSAVKASRSYSTATRSYGNLKDSDRIFTNLYNDESPWLDGALKRVRYPYCHHIILLILRQKKIESSNMNRNCWKEKKLSKQTSIYFKRDLIVNSLFKIMSFHRS